MTLPSSGSLNYNSIRAEFGSPSSNVSLSLYYRGGPYTYNVPANSNIPTGSSSQISISNFYSARGKTDYAAGPFGYHSTGGKVPTVNSGCSNISSVLPNFSDTSMLVGSVQTTTITENRVSASIGASFIFGPFPSNAPLLNRSINYYNTSGTLTHQWYTWTPNTVVSGSFGNSGASYPAPYMYSSSFGNNPSVPANANNFTAGTVNVPNVKAISFSSAWNMSDAVLVIKAF